MRVVPLLLLSLGLSPVAAMAQNAAPPPVVHTGEGRYPWREWAPASAGVARNEVLRTSDSGH